VKSRKDFFTANISDDEIFQLSMEILGGMVHTILEDYSVPTLVKVLGYYLINSVDTYEVKERVSREIGKFIEFAEKANINKGEMYILESALTDFCERPCKD